MMDFIQSLTSFILALGVLITFHEFGHFWVARLCDVKILRFSVGFGRPIYRRLFGRDRSEFVIAILPLGGYVKMLDEREGTVLPAEAHRAFNNKSISRRFAIVVAGPVFNFIFAIMAYWLMYTVGITGLKPTIGDIENGSIAQQAGIEAGDEIISVDHQPTPTWSSVIDVFIERIVEEKQVNFVLKDARGNEKITRVDLSRISIDDMAGGRLMSILGILPERPVIPAVIGEVVKGGAAQRAALQAGDKILAVDGVRVNDWLEWVEIIRKSPEKQLRIELQRDGAIITRELTPVTEVADGERIGRIGAIVDTSFQDDRSRTAIESYSLGPALVKATVKTLDMSIMTLRILGKMLVGKASVKNLSGPISIAQYAGHSAELGLVAFLSFLAIVSVSLGVLNLLPIPLLDGGHLLYYLIELFKGSPVSETVQVIGQQLGLAILLGLMGLAFYNDILRLAG
jgi:regulator of sigma E protease